MNNKLIQIQSTLNNIIFLIYRNSKNYKKHFFRFIILIIQINTFYNKIFIYILLYLILS